MVSVPVRNNRHDGMLLNKRSQISMRLRNLVVLVLLDFLFKATLKIEPLL